MTQREKPPRIDEQRGTADVVSFTVFPSACGETGDLDRPLSDRVGQRSRRRRVGARTEGEPESR